MNFDDLSAVYWHCCSVSTSELDTISIIIIFCHDSLIITEVAQSCWVDRDDLRQHVPEKGFSVWWCCQGASVDIPIANV